MIIKRNIFGNQKQKQGGEQKQRQQNRTKLNQASDIIPWAFQQKCSQFHRQPYEIASGIRYQWVF